MTNKVASIAAVIPAAGRGRRMQSATPKQFLVVHGKTLLQHSVDAVLRDPRVEHVFIASDEQNEHAVAKSLPNISFVAGGATRGSRCFLAYCTPSLRVTPMSWSTTRLGRGFLQRY